MSNSRWIGRFTGRPFGFKSLDQELYSDFSQLRAEREKDDNGIIAWAKSLTEKDLRSELSYTGFHYQWNQNVR